MPRTAPHPSQRRARGFEAAAAVLTSDMKDLAEKRGFAQARLLTHWEQIVGEGVASIARPVRISHGQGLGGTLVLLTTGAHAPVLDMHRDHIVASVNACYGYRAVSRVQITQTARAGLAEDRTAGDSADRLPSARPDSGKLARAMAGIEGVADEGLRGALAKLARNVLTARQD